MSPCLFFSSAGQVQHATTATSHAAFFRRLVFFHFRAVCLSLLSRRIRAFGSWDIVVCVRSPDGCAFIHLSEAEQGGCHHVSLNFSSLRGAKGPVPRIAVAKATWIRRVTPRRSRHVKIDSLHIVQAPRLNHNNTHHPTYSYHACTPS